jgi:hypothetical protein
MHLKIITAYNHKFYDIVNITHPIFIKYCTLKNYSYRIQDLSRYNLSRPPAWSKISIVLEEMEQDPVDFYLWIDADAVILNLDFDPLTFVTETHDIYMTRDFNNLNSGVMLLKHTDYTKKFLQTVWDMTEYIENSSWENEAIIQMYKANTMDLQNHLFELPAKIFNAYEHERYGVTFPDNEICDETFIFHAPALGVNEREELIKKYVNKFYKTN